MPEKPSHIQSIRKARQDVEGLCKFKRALPVLSPFLRLVGVDVNELKKPLAELDRYREQLEAHTRMLDRFNELFARRGWIVYDGMNTDAATAAIAAAEAGNIDDAEDILVRHYTAEQVAVELRMLAGINAFRPRLRLAELALADYREGRHHACVPVVLAQLDGMVNELGNQGFFSENVNLEAWDSIAAYDGGLNELKSLLFRQRSKTTTESRLTFLTAMASSTGWTSPTIRPSFRRNAGSLSLLQATGHGASSGESKTLLRPHRNRR